jgi:hypothetical protein
LAVIVKGTSCAGASRLAAHLTRTDTNERVEVKEIRGVAAADLLGALREMQAVAAGTRTTKPFYHGSINTRADERLTDEQRMQAIDRLEATLGLTGQARVVVVHEKEGGEHCHIVWSRIDLDRMAAISDSHNYRKHEEVARALERDFGHERVQGAHIEREGKERPQRTPSHADMLQAERTGISTQQAEELMTEIWQTTRNGKEFQAALEQKGWMLARGDRRDFVAVDPHGGVHSVARRIEGAKATDVRQRFADIDPRDLNSVAEAKQVQRKRHGERDRKGMVAKPRRAGHPLRPKAAKQARASAMPRQPAPGIGPMSPPRVAGAKRVQRERQSGHERDRQGMAAKLRQTGQRLQPEAAKQPRAPAGSRQSAGIDPMSPPSMVEPKQAQRGRQSEHGREHARPEVARPRQSRQQLQPKTVEQAHTRAGPRQPPRGIDPIFPPRIVEAKQMRRGRRGERDRQGMVAKPRQARQRLQPKAAEQARASAGPRHPASIDPVSPASAAEAKQVQHGRQNEHGRDRAWPGAANPHVVGQRLQPEAADQPRASGGPRQPAPGTGRVARPAAKLADSVFKAPIGKTSAPPKEPDPSPQGQDANAPSQRRHELMRQLSREIPQKTEREAERELVRGRERNRAGRRPGAGAAPARASKAGPPRAKPVYFNPADRFRGAKRSVTHRRRPRRRIQVTTKGRGEVRAQGAPSLAEEANKALRQQLPNIRGQINADQQEVRDPAGLPSQSQAGSNGRDSVRSAKPGDRNPDIIAGMSGDANAIPGVSAEFRSAMAALLAFYAVDRSSPAKLNRRCRQCCPAGDIERTDGCPARAHRSMACGHARTAGGKAGKADRKRAPEGRRAETAVTTAKLVEMDYRTTTTDKRDCVFGSDVWCFGSYSAPTLVR